MPKYNQFLNEVLSGATKIRVSGSERTFIDLLIDKLTNAADEAGHSRSICLAAAFDLLVARSYYDLIKPKGWMFCPHNKKALVHPFINCCPICSVQGSFHFHKANKQQSAVIGKEAINNLCKLLLVWANKQNKSLDIFRGKEPVDLIILDSNSDNVILAEVKAAPLLTPAITVPYRNLPTQIQDSYSATNTHESVEFNFTNAKNISILIPEFVDGSWNSIFYKLRSYPAKNWAGPSLENLLRTERSFPKTYLDFWVKSYDVYASKGTDCPLFWGTSACGTPNPRPSHWPKRSGGSGYESISDAKTSFGFDRTDDIKKAIYQTLKIQLYRPLAQKKPIYL